jgi:hypothetical protein
MVHDKEGPGPVNDSDDDEVEEQKPK